MDSTEIRSAALASVQGILDRTGWSAADLARLSGVSKATIHRALQPDGNFVPSLRTMSLLSAAETKSTHDEHDSETSVGARLRRARKARSMSTAELAQIAHVSISTVRNQENGTNGVPLSSLHVYAEALGVDQSWLAFGDGAPPTPTPKPSVAAGPIQMTTDNRGNAHLQIDKTVPIAVALKVLDLLEGGE